MPSHHSHTCPLHMTEQSDLCQEAHVSKMADSCGHIIRVCDPARICHTGAEGQETRTYLLRLMAGQLVKLLCL